MDAEVSRVLADDYLHGLTSRPVPELRSLRAECQAVETKLSYLRRLVQGRLDIVSGERQRRQAGGAPGDIAGLIERLPEILSDRIRGPGTGRLPATFEPGELSGTLVSRLNVIGDGNDADDEELHAAVIALTELEGEVSSLRRAMFDRIDRIETELTARYRDGTANVDDLLSNGDSFT
ncbi:MAG: hypothetical protein ABI239_12700 [Aquihabitans sp.]